MKKNPLYFYVPFFLLVIAVLFAACKGDKPNFLLTKVAKEVDKVCPFKLDDETTMDSCKALPNNVLRYYYTITSQDSDSLSMNKITSLKVYMEQGILETINQQKQTLQMLSDINTTFEYLYKDVHGKQLILIKIPKDIYSKYPYNLSDEYVNAKIDTIVHVLKLELPFVDVNYDTEFVDVKNLGSRTVAFYLKQNDLQKSTSFDSIAFKNTTKEWLVEDYKENMLNKILYGSNITHQFHCSDKNGDYLCTIEILPEDYQTDEQLSDKQ